MTRAPRSTPPAFSSVDEVAALLRRSGGRLSAVRRAILDVLFAADGPVAAERIAAGGPDAAAPLDLASVYRNLERLEELGIVRHVHLGHGPGLYALTGGGEREYLVCERCDRVTIAPAAQLDRVRAAIREDFGYDARFTHFPIHGLCATCLAEGASTDDDVAAARAHSHGTYVHAHPHAHSHSH